MIAANQMLVFRFHDHWHAMKPDGIATGMARALGWESHALAGHRPPFPANGARYGFTGLHSLYEPSKHGERQYWCERRP